MTAVKVLQDSSGHWYVVPNDEVIEFSRLSSLLENEDSEQFDVLCEEFDFKFAMYRTGGDLNLVQLFISD